MTVFTNNTNDLTGNVLNYLSEFNGMTKKQARNFFNENIVADGGTYGEQSRFHLSASVTGDKDLMNLILAYADKTQD